MRRINLLPSARRGGGRSLSDRLSFFRNLPPRTWMVIISGGALLIAAILILSVTTKKNAVASRTQQVEQELIELRVIVDEVNDLRDLKETLDQKMSVVDRLIIGRLCYARFLNRVAHILSDDQEIARRAWIVSLAFNQVRTMEERRVEKKNRKGEITTEIQRVPVVKLAVDLVGVVGGDTGATHLVGTLMESFGTDPIMSEYIENVELVYIRDAQSRILTLGKEFKLNLFLKKRDSTGA